MISLSGTKLATTLVAFSVLLAGGCASTRPSETSGPGAIQEPLAVDPNDPSLLWWERDGFDWSRYRGVILEPVEVRLNPDGSAKQVSAQDGADLAAEFRAIVVEELSGQYAIADDPAPEVLRIRCALTDVRPGNPAVNVITSLVAFVPMDIGGAAIEVEFIDSMTGERVAAGIDRKRGSILPGLEGLTRYGHARQAFRQWARELRVAMETNR
jgi:hypothetical protein